LGPADEPAGANRRDAGVVADGRSSFRVSEVAPRAESHGGKRAHTGSPRSEVSGASGIGGGSSPCSCAGIPVFWFVPSWPSPTAPISRDEILEILSMALSPKDVTRLLEDVNTGEKGAWERLLDRVYEELKSMARGQMAHEREGHLLQTTALVNEAYLRLVQNRDEQWANRAHFFSAAATAMRRILVDEARARLAGQHRGRR